MTSLKKHTRKLLLVAIVGLGLVALSHAQRPMGPGGGPDAPDVEIVIDFDADGDGLLNTQERKEARASLKQNNAQRDARRGPPGGGRGGQRTRGTVGERVDVDDVEAYPDSKLYDPTVLRTLFLEFPQQDWEQELADFKPTDVEVPANLTVDGQVYPEVGVSFRGASSFFQISAGSKRSLNLSLDYRDEEQKLYGYKSLNLLNCNGDPTMMSSLLYSQIASEKIATPKVNFVKVVINGRSWGIYANAQQFNKDFVEENYGTRKGARWKVSGSPHGDAGLRYLGDDVQEYRSRFDIKSKDKQQSWDNLINLCKLLNQTPANQLEEALTPILDIDGALWFLAVDVALINSDGYWTRASDYSIYEDPNGKFHILPHDMNEAFRVGHGGGPGSGPGGPPVGMGQRPPRRPGPPEGGGQRGQRRAPRQGGPRGQRGRNGDHSEKAAGYELDPLVAIEERFPLRSKLLAIPKFRTQYLQYIHVIASEMIAWKHLGPRVEAAKDLIGKSVIKDTRKLMSNDAFNTATSSRKPAQAGSLREFSEKRSAYLLNHPEVIKAIARQ